MSVIDILTRIHSIYQKLDKCVVDKHRNEASNLTGDDGFARLYASVNADINSALEIYVLHNVRHKNFEIYDGSFLGTYDGCFQCDT